MHVNSHQNCFLLQISLQETLQRMQGIQADKNNLASY